MKKPLIIIGLLIASIIGVILSKHSARPSAKPVVATQGEASLPKLLDLGAGKCAACKAMTEILDEMTITFEGQLEVEFIDVWEHEEIADQYGIKIIPVQIFFDPEGNELFRHEGFFGREAMLAKWKELGYAFEDSGQARSGLFARVTRAFEGAPAIALGAAFIWGLLSMLLSPCHLAGIPLIIGFIDDRGETSPMQAFLVSLLFALGILVTIAIIGVVTAMAGRLIGDIGRWGNWFISIIFFVVGLHLLGVIPLGWNKPEHAGEKRKGLFAAFILGLVFGIALGPCSFAYMAPLLGITFKLGSEQPIYAGALLLMYGIGHCSLIALAGTSAGWVQKYRDWNLEKRGSLILKRICGILVILGGLYIIYTAP